MSRLRQCITCTGHHTLHPHPITATHASMHILAFDPLVVSPATYMPTITLCLSSPLPVSCTPLSNCPHTRPPQFGARDQPPSAWSDPYGISYTLGYKFATHFGPTQGTGNVVSFEAGNEPCEGLLGGRAWWMQVWWGQ